MTDCEHGCHVPTHEETRAVINRHGLAIIGVFASKEGETPFTYTIGLTEKYGFEMICIGLNNTAAGSIFNAIAAEMKQGAELDLDTEDDRWANLPVIFKRTTKDTSIWVRQADNFYGRQVEVVQMVICDENGRFPGHHEYNAKGMALQKLLY